MKTIQLICLLAIIPLADCAHAPAKGSNSEKAMQKTTPAPDNSDNPFFSKWNTPFEVPPFDRIKPSHFMPAVEEGIRRQDAAIAAITANTAAPDFANTIAALDRSGEFLRKVTMVFYGMYSADTNKDLDAIAKDLAPLLEKHSGTILQNKKLFARIEKVYEQKDKLGLNAEQNTLLEETLLDFIQGGAKLDDKQKAELRKINERLAQLQVHFSQNVLKDDNGFKLVLDKESDLEGLPATSIQAAAEAAKAAGMEGKWIFTLHKPSLIPFLQFSRRRDLRQKMLEAYTKRGANGNENDNRKIVVEIVSLRLRKAKLLGYKTYADMAISRRMAKTPEAVRKLLDKIWKPSLAVARREAQAMQKLIDAEGGKFRLQPWDWWYYAEKVRKAKYDLDENQLRPYFKLENVMQGAFDLAGRLYGLKFIPRTDIPKYHPDVKTFEVRAKDDRLVGILFLDYFTRPSKRGGAWCGGFRSESKEHGVRIAPLVTNVANFTKPTQDKPSLLSLEEVTTLFHEFGHALNMLQLQTTYNGTGEDIKVDFVELPSQFMENFAVEPAILKTYARHYKTGEVMPDELMAKITNSGHFNQGFATVEYMAASYLDLAWHSLAEVGADLDTESFEKGVMKKIGLIKQIVSRYQSTNFRHAFSGDFYAAGYYSYIWSAVLDADAFKVFKDAGLFDPKVSKSFLDNILSKGGSEDPMTLYKRFRGSEPRIEPLLERRGLLNEE